MRKFTVFDIETGALSDEEIERIAPPFDHDAVKTGNLGLEKAMEKIATAQENHLKSIKAKAALKAEYGRVLAIGWCDGNVTTILANEKDETSLIKNFWEAADEAMHRREWFVGFNIFNFDLPFLVRRSIVNGIPVPPGLLPKNSRYWPDFFIDLMTRWQAGDYRELISLDRFAKALGHSGKNGSGKNFAKLLKEDENAAIEYLENDLVLTRKVGEACFLST